jgi:hypothetical protein
MPAASCLPTEYVDDAGNLLRDIVLPDAAAKRERHSNSGGGSMLGYDMGADLMACAAEYGAGGELYAAMAGGPRSSDGGGSEDGGFGLVGPAGLGMAALQGTSLQMAELQGHLPANCEVDYVVPSEEPDLFAVAYKDPSDESGHAGCSVWTGFKMAHFGWFASEEEARNVANAAVGMLQDERHRIANALLMVQRGGAMQRSPAPAGNSAAAAGGRGAKARQAQQAGGSRASGSAALAGMGPGGLAGYGMAGAGGAAGLEALQYGGLLAGGKRGLEQALGGSAEYADAAWRGLQVRGGASSSARRVISRWLPLCRSLLKPPCSCRGHCLERCMVMPPAAVEAPPLEQPSWWCTTCLRMADCTFRVLSCRAPTTWLACPTMLGWLALGASHSLASSRQQGLQTPPCCPRASGHARMMRQRVGMGCTGCRKG